MPPVVIDIRNAEDSRDIVHRTVQALVEGDLVAFPTETVYGLGASARNEEAILRLLKVKDRQEGRPLTLAIKNVEEALDYVPDMSPLALRLARRCWPGPVTLVMEHHHPDSLLHQLPPASQKAFSPNGSIGMRVPTHAIIHDVMQMLVGPLALTSANRSGESEALTAQQVVEAMDDDVQLVLDDGRSRFGQPSSVIQVGEKDFEVLRAGVVSEQTLKRLSSLMILFVCTGNTCRSPMAEFWCRKMLAEQLGCGILDLEERGILVMSAGIAAMMGGSASRNAVQVMQQEGLNLVGHESQPVTYQLARHADFIFTMTSGHRAAIVSHWPEIAVRTRVLSPDHRDIADPIGGSVELYKCCSDQIKLSLGKRVAEFDFEP